MTKFVMLDRVRVARPDGVSRMYGVRKDDTGTVYRPPECCDASQSGWVSVLLDRPISGANNVTGTLLFDAEELEHLHD